MWHFENVENVKALYGILSEISMLENNNYCVKFFFFFPYYYFSEFSMHFYMVYILRIYWHFLAIIDTFITIQIPKRVIKSIEVYLSTHRDTLSILKLLLNYTWIHVGHWFPSVYLPWAHSTYQTWSAVVTQANKKHLFIGYWFTWYIYSNIFNISLLFALYQLHDYSRQKANIHQKYYKGEHTMNNDHTLFEVLEEGAHSLQIQNIFTFDYTTSRSQ